MKKISVSWDICEWTLSWYWYHIYNEYQVKLLGFYKCFMKNYDKVFIAT